MVLWPERCLYSSGDTFCCLQILKKDKMISYRINALYQLLSYDAAAVQDFFGRVTDFKTCKINGNHANLQLNACCVSSWQNRCDGGSPFTSPKDRNVKRQLRIAERSGWITSEAAKLNAQHAQHAQQIFMLLQRASCSPQGLLSEGNQQKYEQKAKNTCTFCPFCPQF